MIEWLVEAWADFWQVQELLRLGWVTAGGILAAIAAALCFVWYLSTRPGT
jgi:hypothetical protein